MISIIIPIYNAEKTIGCCIDSILYQNISWEKYELILVDDGSTDRSATICRKYANENQNIYYLYQQNKGAAAARNYGMQESSGEWIAFVDADDIVESNFLPTVLKSVMTGSELYIFNIKQERKQIIPFDNIVISSFSDKAKLIDSICGINDNPEIRMPSLAGPFAKIYERKLLERTGIVFDERVLIGEDMLFNIRVILEAVQIECINEVVYTYMYNPVSLMHACHITDLIHPDYFLVEFEKIAESYPQLQKAYEFSFVNSFWALWERDFGHKNKTSTIWEIGRDYNKLLKNVYPYSEKEYRQMYTNRKRLFDVKRRVFIGLLINGGIYPSILFFRMYKLLKRIFYGIR